MAVKQRGLIRWPFVAGLFALGAVMTYIAVAALLDGRPANSVLRSIAIVAIGVVPASVIFAVPTFGLGACLAIVRPARKSGLLLVTYCGAYLSGVLSGALAFVARSS